MKLTQSDRLFFSVVQSPDVHKEVVEELDDLEGHDDCDADVEAERASQGREKTLVVVLGLLLDRLHVQCSEEHIGLINIAWINEKWV